MDDSISFLIFIFAVVYFVFNGIVANFFQKAAALKGYGTEMHVFAMVFFFGILGALYVVALPDKIQQEQNQKILNQLTDERGTKNEEMQCVWETNI